MARSVAKRVPMKRLTSGALVALGAWLTHAEMGRESRRCVEVEAKEMLQYRACGLLQGLTAAGSSLMSAYADHNFVHKRRQQIAQITCADSLYTQTIAQMSVVARTSEASNNQLAKAHRRHPECEKGKT